MSPDQMKMLSVKATIERAIQAYVTINDTVEKVGDEVERFVAGLFASRQISKNYSITTSVDRVEVTFAVEGNMSMVNYLISKPLKSTANVPQPPGAANAPIARAEDILSKMRPSKPQSNQVVFEQGLPQLESILDEYTRSENTPTNRQRIKQKIWDEAKKVYKNSDDVWVVCDETNNPQFTRQHELIVTVEVKFPNDDNTYIADMKLHIMGTITRSDPLVIKAVGTAFAVLDTLDVFNTPTTQLNLRLKEAIIKAGAHDARVSTLVVDPLVRISLEIQPYEYSNYISYPLTRTK